MSMSMLSQHTGVMDVEIDSPIGIKNTFVHIQDVVVPTASRRRSSSAPPTMQAASPEPSCDMPLSKLHLCTDDSNASTSDQDNDAYTSDADSTTVDSSPRTCYISIAPLSPQRTPLSLATKAWSPSQGPVAPLGGVPLDLRHRLSRTIVKAKELFGAFTLIQRTALMENCGVWSLVGYCLPQHRNYAQILLARAKMALVAEADNSTDVFVIGHDGAAFAVSHNQIGMSVQLALVEDKCSACWDILTKGFCPRGHACRWQHPLWKAPVTIAIAFE